MGSLADRDSINDEDSKVTNEENEADKVYKEYAEFCDDESVAEEYAVKDSKKASLDEKREIVANRKTATDAATAAAIVL